MATTNSPSRRAVLKAGSAGVLAAAFLSACSEDEPVGISGSPSDTTEVPPVVRPKAPTEAQLAEVQVQLNTLASVEALAVEQYATLASRITDPELAPHVNRFGADHTAAVDALVALTDEQTDAEPNAYLQENLVGPAQDSLVTEDNVRVFLRNIESTLAATYVNAMVSMLDAEMRQTLMTFGGASARRVTLLGDGELPHAAVFPPTDLIANDAFLGGEEAAEGDAEGGDAEAENGDAEG